MSVRLLLAVVLAGALVAASMPAIHSAQRTQAEYELSTNVEEIESATTAMIRHSDPVMPGVPGATQQITVTPPAQPEGVSLTIGPAPDLSPRNASRLTTTIPGEPPARTRLNVPVRPLGPDGTVQWSESLTIRESTELTLTYRRVDGTPVITVARGFK